MNKALSMGICRYLLAKNVAFDGYAYCLPGVPAGSWDSGSLLCLGRAVFVPI